MHPHPVQAELQAAAVEFAFDQHFLEAGGWCEAASKVLLQIGIAGTHDKGQLGLGVVIKQALVVAIDDLELRLQQGGCRKAVAGGERRIGVLDERAE